MVWQDWLTLYLLIGAVYSWTWYKQEEIRDLPPFLFALQIILCITGYPWLMITEMIMKSVYDDLMDEIIKEKISPPPIDDENAVMFTLDEEKAARFKKFLEELTAEALEEKKEEDLKSPKDDV